MGLGIDTVKDAIQTIVAVIGIIAIVIGVIGYFLSKNQFGFNVTVRCVEKFQKILPELETLDKKTPHHKERILRQYIDLCEEELFYFKKRYLPREIIEEWIEGMLNYLPLYDGHGNLLNENCKLRDIDKSPLLSGYPRIRDCFGYDLHSGSTSDRAYAGLIPVVRGRLKKSR